jgi:natural product precursor
MKKLTRLSLNELAKTMPTLSEKQLRTFIGGTNPGDGSMDCAFQSVSYVTGLSVLQVEQGYAQYMIDTYDNGMSLSSETALVVANGVTFKDVNNYVDQFGFQQSGPGGSGPGAGGSGDLISIGNGKGGGHMVVFGSSDSSGNVQYYDPQNHVSGTLTSSDVYTIYSSTGCN